MITREELVELMREQSQAAGGQKELARRWGISLSYVNDVIASRREPGKTILAALGFRRLVFYQKIRREP